MFILIIIHIALIKPNVAEGNPFFVSCVIHEIFSILYLVIIYYFNKRVIEHVVANDKALRSKNISRYKSVKDVSKHEMVRKYQLLKIHAEKNDVEAVERLIDVSSVDCG